MDERHEKEMVDRLRRIETRLTKYMLTQGFDTQSQKPTWLGDGVIDIPSRSCALSDCLEAIPADWVKDEGVTILCKGQFVADIFLAPE